MFRFRLCVAVLLLLVETQPSSAQPESDGQAELRQEMGDAFGYARSVIPWLFVAFSVVSLGVLVAVYLSRRPVRLKRPTREELPRIRVTPRRKQE